MKSKYLLLTTVILAMAGNASAQLTDDFHPAESACCLPRAGKVLAAELDDWNQLGRYHAANMELKKQPSNPRRVVFMGDSITDFWRLEEYFPGQPFVNRGISGQTTPQMLVRMYADVIDLKPAAMVVLAGTNDIAQNTGPMTAEMIEQDIMAMTELAQAHSIKVLLCSITPVSDYPFLAQQSGAAPPPQPAAGRGGGRAPAPRQRMTIGRPPADIVKLNAWMKEYAARVNAIYVDYYSAMVDEKGWLKDGVSNDGLHPTDAGYKIMAPIVSAAIERAVK
jgi:lysophospholipase L1-like esterase